MGKFMKKELEDRALVGESEKTRKARKKLEERMQTLEKKVTKEALKETSESIVRWIDRHAHNRLAVSDKSISLFDKNQNSASPSKEILKMQSSLEEKMNKMATK